KNADKVRDPEMHPTKKGNPWYFGMKGHFGVDSRSKLIHAVQATPANVADSTVLPDLLNRLHVSLENLRTVMIIIFGPTVGVVGLASGFFLGASRVVGKKNSSPEGDPFCETAGAAS